jgi:hypothetical protein
MGIEKIAEKLKKKGGNIHYPGKNLPGAPELIGKLKQFKKEASGKPPSKIGDILARLSGKKSSLAEPVKKAIAPKPGIEAIKTKVKEKKA